MCKGSLVTAGLDKVSLGRKEFLESGNGAEPSGWEGNTQGMGDLELLGLASRQVVTPRFTPF